MNSFGKTILIFSLLCGMGCSNNSDKAAPATEQAYDPVIYKRSSDFADANNFLEPRDLEYECSTNLTENNHSIFFQLDSTGELQIPLKPLHNKRYDVKHIQRRLTETKCRPVVVYKSGEDLLGSDVAEIVLSQQFINEILPELLQSGSPACYSKILSFYEPYNILALGCIDKASTKFCARHINALKSTYSVLDSYLATANENPDSFSYQSALEETLKKSEAWKGSSRIQIQPNIICNELPVGESRIIAEREGVARVLNKELEYKLTRVSEKDYLIELNNSFSPTCQVDEAKKTELHTKWVSKVNKCLETFQPYFYGIDRRLKIEVISKDTFDSPKKNIISIERTRMNFEKNQYKATSEQYFTNLDCDTILHETLHLLGFVDEYYDSDYNRRSLGPSNSIMNNAYNAVWNTINTGSSLIMPGHMKLLLFPNCNKKNALYFKCSSYAYDSSANSEKIIPQECKSYSKWIEDN